MFSSIRRHTGHRLNVSRQVHMSCLGVAVHSLPSRHTCQGSHISSPVDTAPGIVPNSRSSKVEPEWPEEMISMALGCNLIILSLYKIHEYRVRNNFTQGRIAESARHKPTNKSIGKPEHDKGHAKKFKRGRIVKCVSCKKKGIYKGYK